MKETYDEIKSAYAPNSRLTPQQKEKKMEEALGKIKESYNDIQVAYG